MVDDRDREIENFKPEEYWTLDANLDRRSDVKKLPFTARYHGKDGKKAELKSAERGGGSGAEETKNAAFTVKSVKRTDKQRISVPAVHHLHHAAGGVPQAQHDAPAHHGHRPAAL